MSFQEDGPAIFPFDTDDFSITDEDNSFIVQATITIENSESTAPNVQDQLMATGNDLFSVTGNGTTSLFIEAVGPTRLITTHSMLVTFLRSVSFTSNDQAASVVRNLSVVAEEFPVGEAARVPTFIPITIISTNDQPMLNSSRISEAVLMDYLPQDRQNLGFNSSFLLSSADVIDVDRETENSLDFIGLAITGVNIVPADLGVWQYRNGDSTIQWMPFPGDLSSCNPHLVNPSMNIRFSPSPSINKADGVTNIEYRAWDGSSTDNPCLDLGGNRGMLSTCS